MPCNVLFSLPLIGQICRRHRCFFNSMFSSICLVLHRMKNCNLFTFHYFIYYIKPNWIMFQLWVFILQNETGIQFIWFRNELSWFSRRGKSSFYLSDINMILYLTTTIGQVLLLTCYLWLIHFFGEIGVWGIDWVKGHSVFKVELSAFFETRQ